MADNVLWRKYHHDVTPLFPSSGVTSIYTRAYSKLNDFFVLIFLLPPQRFGLCSDVRVVIHLAAFDNMYVRVRLIIYQSQKDIELNIGI
jgi:hypothetical protein